MRILITGGSGFVGSYLTKKLCQKGHTVTILTRKIKATARLARGASFLEGNPTAPGPWQESIAGHQIVINLAGTSIFQRWSRQVKKQIIDSRILTTENIVNAISRQAGAVPHLLSASAVGYYGFHSDEVLCEGDNPADDFLAGVARSWEASALRARKTGTRVVLCRFGVVLGKQGGALAQLVPLFRWCLGAALGSGRQWFSWIHEEDLANIFLFLLEHSDLEGPVNCTAPYPVQNSEMTRVLAEALKRPVLFPSVPSFVLKVLKGEFANVLVKGQRVIPRRLLDEGYHFLFPTVKEALENLLA